MKAYGIKDGYQVNKMPGPLDQVPGKAFWNAENIAISRRAQFSVYKRAYEIARENNLETVLDIGCGVANKLHHFFGNGFKIYGIDQPGAVEHCVKACPEGTFVADNFVSPTFVLKEYLKSAPLIICADVIEHMENPDHLLNYIKAFADGKTFIIISTPERDSLAGKNSMRPENPHHIREWSMEEFAQYLTSSGFNITEHRIVLPVKFGFDFKTIKYSVGRWMAKLPLRQTQVAVCRLNAN